MFGLVPRAAVGRAWTVLGVALAWQILVAAILAVAALVGLRARDIG